MSQIQGGKNMLYEELLMDTSTLSKFHLFKYLKKAEHAALSAAQIAETMQLNYQQTIVILTSIEQDLEQLSPDTKKILTGAGKIDLTAITTTIDGYRYFLLKNSTAFQFILYLLNDAEPTIEKFCELYYISRSTVSRKLANLKQYLKGYGLRFTYNEVDLVGDERLVRLALFDFLWLSSRGLEWPLEIPEKQAEELAEYFRPYFSSSETYLGHLELKLLMGIMIARQQNRHFAAYDKAYDFLMAENSYYPFENLLPVFQQNSRSDIIISDEQSRAESSFVFFIAHIVPSFTSRENRVLEHTLRDFTSKPNPVYQLVDNFLSFAKTTFLEESFEIFDNPLLIGNMLHVTFAFHVLKQPFPNVQSLVIQPHQNKSMIDYLENRITDFLKTQSTQEYPFLTEKTIPLLSKTYKNLLAPYYKHMKISQSLKVGIAIEPNYLLVYNLEQFLSDLQFAEAEPFLQDKADTYDLIISSSPMIEKLYPTQHVYLWDHTYEHVELAKLYKKLRQLYVEKNRF
jgi:hypothetical protein